MYDPHLGFDPAIPFAILGIATPCAIYVWRSIVNRKKKAAHLAELNRQQEELRQLEWEEEMEKARQNIVYEYDEDELEDLIEEFQNFNEALNELIEVVSKNQIDLRKLTDFLDNNRYIDIEKAQHFTEIAIKAFKEYTKLDENKEKETREKLAEVHFYYGFLRNKVKVGRITEKRSIAMLNEYIINNPQKLDQFTKVEKFLDDIYKAANKKPKEI